MLATAALVMAPWLAHQVTTYGWNDPLAMTRHAEVVGDQPRFAGFSLDYIWSFLTITFHSFWAQFGWMAIPATETLYWIWGLLAGWRRARPGSRSLIGSASQPGCWWRRRSRPLSPRSSPTT